MTNNLSPVTRTLFLIHFSLDLKVLAEQQAGKKAAATENERDRSPIRGNRTPLLPDPVPGSFAQAKSKRRALLPTPPGTQDETPAATNPTEGADPVARWGHYTLVLGDQLI